MGITAFDIKILEKYIKEYKPVNVIEFGSQNLYITSENTPPFSSAWYNEQGLYYKCIDLGGDNNADKKDLSKPISIGRQYDLVTDFGFSEHVVKMEDFTSVTYGGNITSIYPKGEIKIEEGYYNCWLNKHNLCKIGGLIISENPKTGNWPLHGYTYITQEFYKELAKIADYEILELGDHPAMGNDIDGWNIYCVLKKTGDKFPSFEKFTKLSIYEK